MQLPPAYVARPASVADSHVAHELLSANDTRVIGHPDVTLTDVRDLLANPRVEATLIDRGETPVAFANLRRDGERALLEICTLDDVLGPALLAGLEERATPAKVLRTFTYSEDARTAAWLEAAGWRVSTGFARMRRDLRQPVVPPPPVDDVVIRRGGPVDDDLRAAHLVHQEAFRDHHGFEPVPFEIWREDWDSRSTVDWSQLWLAEPAAGGTAVAMILSSDEFLESDNAGFVALLGVLRGWRGRGIARTLLSVSMREMRRRKLTAAFLQVDRQGSTGAYALYESLGMRAVMEIDAWEKRPG